MDVMEGWKSFLDTYNQALDRYVPKAGGNLKSKKPRRKQRLWMNKKALSKVKKKKAAFARYVQTREGKDYQEYAKARNQAGAECKRAIKQYEKSMANKAKSNPKAFYAYANSKMKTKQGIAELTDEKGNTATSNKDKADTLNRFLCSVFTQEDVPQCEKRKIRSKLTNVIFTREEIRRKLEKLDPGKSPGPDGLHSRALKELAEEIAEPLSIIFTKSMEEGKLPRIWKDATITPIFKKGDNSNPGNYRPVSLTSIVCKVMESIIRDKIMKHLHLNDLLSECQHGFIPMRSCVTNLLEVINKWTEALDEGKPIDAVYLDFAEAFDSVPHQRLILKIDSYGITSKDRAG